MKTIEQAQNEHYLHKDFEVYSFEAGVYFAQTWIKISDEHPEHDSWVLVKTDLCRFPCQVCQVKIDKFISTDNKIVLNVTHWRPIEYK